MHDGVIMGQQCHFPSHKRQIAYFILRKQTPMVLTNMSFRLKTRTVLKTYQNNAHAGISQTGNKKKKTRRPTARFSKMYELSIVNKFE